jgi:hypothetical protein
MSLSVPVNHCTSNLTSGFIDLATYDELEKYMYGGPDATAYFVRETRKSTWFTQCPVMLAKCNGTPEFGAEWSCSISRAGDYLLGTWLHVVTPRVSLTSADGNNSKCIAWTPNFMHALVKECCITFNDLVAARFDGTHLDFWAAFTTPASKAAGYAKMIGAALPTTGKALESQHLNLPLPFFYARDSGVALPTAALPYNEMRINFVFRDWREMLCVFQEADGCTCNDLVEGSVTQVSVKSNVDSVTFVKEPSLGSNAVQVWANYAIVSNEERKRMACAPRDMLIEQVQTMPTHKYSQKYNPSLSTASLQNNVSVDLRFSHAIKVLFFGAKNLANRSVHSNYTSGIPVVRGVDRGSCVPASANSACATGVNCLELGCCNAKDPLSRASLVYENTNRLGLMTVDYYSEVQPYYHAPAIPVDGSWGSTWCQEGLHMYSYSLDFICLDPLGSTNYGKLTNVQLNFESQPDLATCGAGGATGFANQKAIVDLLVETKNYNSVDGTVPEVSYELVCTAVNNNIIRISGGALGFPVL